MTARTRRATTVWLVRLLLFTASLVGVLVAHAVTSLPPTGPVPSYSYDDASQNALARSGEATYLPTRAASGRPVHAVFSGARPARIAPVVAAEAESTGVLQAGEGGSYSELSSRGEVGDQLTPHHMPQAAAGYTGYGEGGAWSRASTS
jgi:hypothetical protein